MKLVSWNVNGFRAVLGKGLDAYLKQEEADIYCFQEVKANPDQVPDWQPPKGYTAFWNPAERKGYSGTMMLSRIDPINYLDGIGEPEGDLEGRVQTLEKQEERVRDKFEELQGELQQMLQGGGAGGPGAGGPMGPGGPGAGGA